MERVTRNLGLVAVAGLLTVLTARPAVAQEGEGWNTLEPVYNVTTIKIHPNMGEQYLQNLKRTWVTGVEAAIEEGLTEDYWVFSSLTPNDGGYNLMIVTKHPNLAALDATDAWRERIARIDATVQQTLSEQESDEITGNVYPNIRTITSEKMLREIEFTEN